MTLAFCRTSQRDQPSISFGHVYRLAHVTMDTARYHKSQRAWRPLEHPSLIFSHPHTAENVYRTTTPERRNVSNADNTTRPTGFVNLYIPLDDNIINQLVCSNGNHESETTISVGGGDDGVFHDRHDPIPHYSPGYGRIPNDATSPPPPSPCKGGVQYHPLFHHDNGRENVVVASIITVS